MDFNLINDWGKRNLDLIFESITLLEKIDNFNPDDPSKYYIYHTAKQKDIDSIFKYGFESFYLGKNVGNLYGRGVYATSDLESSISNATGHKGYGNIIIKAQLLSYENYLIWEKDLAKKVYGDKWLIADQLNMIVPQDIIEESKNIQYNNETLYSFITKYDTYTSVMALTVYNYRKRFKGKSIYDFIEGFAFYGSNDGHVVVIKNVKNLVPLYYSSDFGKTWEKGYNEYTLKHTIDDFDVDHLYGEKYAKTFVPSNGYAKVMNNSGKINYINKDGEEVSETWLDSGGDFTDYNGVLLATVVYNNHTLVLGTDGAIYESPEDEYPIMFSDSLKDI